VTGRRPAHSDIAATRVVALLRVIDASMMPTLISGNTQAPSIMIGEKGAHHVVNGEAAPQMRRNDQPEPSPAVTLGRRAAG
jgi:choline dehydrogenase-like flavoprotein